MIVECAGMSALGKRRHVAALRKISGVDGTWQRSTWKFEKQSKPIFAHLLPLMRELAEFEKYAEDFAVTEEALREQGFQRSPPDFHCLIAEDGGESVGFLVYYFVPFTYRAKPNLIIKELYIAGQHRSRGAGQTADESCSQRSSADWLRDDQVVGREME